MLDQARMRTDRLRTLLADNDMAAALLTDESSIAYFAGFWGYLGIEFGRPTFLLVFADADPIVITPLMESEMVSAMTWVQDIRTWEDAGAAAWPTVLGTALAGIGAGHLGVEVRQLPAMVGGFLDQAGHETRDVGELIGGMRMIKSPAEIEVMKQAGVIAGAMMHAAHESLAEGVPEYESALAVINAGTRSAAGFLTDKGWEAFVSPMIHNLQILQSGHDTSMVHRRASVKRYSAGDPVYFCFCNMAQFKLYKLGFDRMFFVQRASEQARRVQQVAIDAQQAAINAIRPGVRAEEVALAADEVYALLTNEQFLAERIEAVGEDPPEVKVSKRGKKVSISLQRAARRDLPKVAAKVIGNVQRFSMQEDWQPDGDGWSGNYVIKFEGVPGSVAADFELYPTDDGCVYSITHTPKVNMPIVGKTLQKILASQIEDGCDAEIDYLVETLG